MEKCHPASHRRCNAKPACWFYATQANGEGERTSARMGNEAKAKTFTRYAAWRAEKPAVCHEFAMQRIRNWRSKPIMTASPMITF